MKRSTVKVIAVLFTILYFMVFVFAILYSVEQLALQKNNLKGTCFWALVTIFLVFKLGITKMYEDTMKEYDDNHKIRRRSNRNERTK